MIINSGIFYYSNGEIKGEIGAPPNGFYEYLPKTNQILFFMNGANGGNRILYGYNGISSDYSDVITRFSHTSQGYYGIDGAEVGEDQYYEKLSNLTANLLDYTYLTRSDVDGDFTAYFEEKLFYDAD